MRSIVDAYLRLGLVPLIVLALVIGTITGVVAPSFGLSLGILGSIFVGALKAVAPILVFVLVLAAVSNQRIGADSRIKPIIFLYLVGTFSAALVAVGASFMFPTELVLNNIESIEQAAPQSLREVLTNLVMNLVANPVASLANANYMGILTWAVLIGLALRHVTETTLHVVSDLGMAVTSVVKWIIALAPFGILGLVASTVAETGIQALVGYARLLAVLVGSMLFIALVMNPTSLR